MAPALKTIRLRSYAPRSSPPTRRAPLPLKAHQLKDVAGKLKERKAELQLTDSQSEAVVKDVLGIVQDILMEGDDVVLRGFGKFTSREVGKRSYRNPRTGETVVKNSSVRVGFRPSAALKRTVAQAHEDALEE